MAEIAVKREKPGIELPAAPRRKKRESNIVPFPRRVSEAEACRRELTRAREAAEKAEAAADEAWEVCMCVPGRARFFR